LIGKDLQTDRQTFIRTDMLAGGPGQTGRQGEGGKQADRQARGREASRQTGRGRGEGGKQAGCRRDRQFLDAYIIQIFFRRPDFRRIRQELEVDRRPVAFGASVCPDRARIRDFFLNDVLPKSLPELCPFLVKLVLKLEKVSLNFFFLGQLAIRQNKLE
jgi:hypothetical protein